jgi:hypothetical protein
MRDPVSSPDLVTNSNQRRSPAGSDASAPAGASDKVRTEDLGGKATMVELTKALVSCIANA